MSVKVYAVTGMTCDHCVAAVRGEVSNVPGVTDVNVDLAAGRVSVDGTGFTDEQIRAAVDEAGYTLVAS